MDIKMFLDDLRPTDFVIRTGISRSGLTKGLPYERLALTRGASFNATRVAWAKELSIGTEPDQQALPVETDEALV